MLVASDRTPHRMQQPSNTNHLTTQPTPTMAPACAAEAMVQPGPNRSRPCQKGNGASVTNCVSIRRLQASHHRIGSCGPRHRKQRFASLASSWVSICQLPHLPAAVPGLDPLEDAEVGCPRRGCEADRPNRSSRQGAVARTLQVGVLDMQTNRDVCDIGFLRSTTLGGLLPALMCERGGRTRP